MNAQRFDDIVTNRAKQRVKDKVAHFERQLAKLFKELHPCLATNTYNRWTSVEAQHHVCAVIRHILGSKESKGKPVGYPEILWEDEEKAVRAELLATLDEMSKALLAPVDNELAPIAKKESKTNDSTEPTEV
jgi:hypothetical protein